MSSPFDVYDYYEVYPLPGGTHYYQYITNKNAIPPAPPKREYYTKEEINKIIEAIAASGVSGEIKSVVCSFEDLPNPPGAENAGTIYNVIDAFTTDSRFLEGAGKKYTGGTNIMVTKNNGNYVFDVLMGEVRPTDDSSIQDIIDDLYKDD